MSMARPAEAEIVAAIVDKTFYYVGKAYLVRDPLVNPVVSTRSYWIDPVGNTVNTKRLLAVEVAKALNELSPEGRRDVFENERVSAAFCDIPRAVTN